MIKRAKKFILGTVGISLLALTMSASAFAESTEQKVEVVGSGLRLFQTAIQFNDIKLDVKKAQVSQAKTDMYSIDGRGSDGGWTASLSSTDFMIEKEVNGVTEQFYIPASAVAITTQYKGAVTGAAIDFTKGNGTLSTKKVLSNSAQPIIQANPSYGGGTHHFGVTYDLKLPQMIMKQDGTKLGVLQGQYKALFTYQMTSGI